MNIPMPTAMRLQRLSQLLSDSKQPVVTSAQIERQTGWSSNTIRKDISLLGADVSTNAGYDAALLSRVIYERLGLASEKKCCIVGLGRLGSAFLRYPGFCGSPFKIVAGFDRNVNRLEILEADFPLYPVFKQKEIIPRLGVEYALLCVSVEQAQTAAEKLAECGIKGIVNFTPTLLSLPDGVETEQLSPRNALYALAARISVAQNSLRTENTNNTPQNRSNEEEE